MEAPPPWDCREDSVRQQPGQAPATDALGALTMALVVINIYNPQASLLLRVMPQYLYFATPE